MLLDRTGRTLAAGSYGAALDRGGDVSTAVYRSPEGTSAAAPAASTSTVPTAAQIAADRGIGLFAAQAVRRQLLASAPSTSTAAGGMVPDALGNVWRVEAGGPTRRNPEFAERYPAGTLAPLNAGVDPTTGTLTGPVYTGTVGVVRGTTAAPEAIDRAIDLAAQQRANAYGLPPDAARTIADYRRQTGYFPDLSSFVLSPQSGIGFVDAGAGADLVEAGMLPRTWSTWVIVGAIGIGLVWLVGERVR